MIGAAVLGFVMLLSHHGDQSDPVVIHKTGLGFWEAIADGRHLAPKQRRQFIAALGSATFPSDADTTTQWGQQRIKDHAAEMMCREDEFMATGLLVEGFTYFDSYRSSLDRHAKARGLCVIWPDDN